MTKLNLEDFVRRGQAAQKAVNELTDTTGPLGTFPLRYTPKVDLIALLKECRMGLSVLLTKEILDYDPSDQAQELIGRLDRIMEDLAMKAATSKAPRDASETEVGMGRMEELRNRPGAVCACAVVVSGPDDDDEIGVLGDGLLLLKHETAKALAVEILKRLQIKPMELEY